MLGSGQSLRLPIKIPFPTLGRQPRGVVVHGTADSDLLDNVYGGITYPARVAHAISV
ncbi:hypothetical protein QSJ19_24680 [Gordonia sp. ABSL11-1]|uniref:hypothetical protein n=1 Tax=Gordonia sp. ABSL11-1 TaxID=3053924 RepID=UPI0025729EE2|nr:hypothetical protein [Gordonia sp. ABSL11-1]MDL9948723.1 hypothetical protein [Gordonia sp. ABSL11-1]